MSLWNVKRHYFYQTGASIAAESGVTNRYLGGFSRQTRFVWQNRRSQGRWFASTISIHDHICTISLVILVFVVVYCAWPASTHSKIVSGILENSFCWGCMSFRWGEALTNFAWNFMGRPGSLAKWIGRICRYTDFRRNELCHYVCRVWIYGTWYRQVCRRWFVLVGMGWCVQLCTGCLHSRYSR